MAVGAFFCVPYLSFLKDERLDRFAGQLRSLIIPPAVVQWLREEVVASDVTEQAARAQTLRRYQMELDRLQTRLDVLYEDRLDGGSMPTHTTKRPRKFVGISNASDARLRNANRQTWFLRRKLST